MDYCYDISSVCMYVYENESMAEPRCVLCVCVVYVCVWCLQIQNESMAEL